jgi:hypothetical protein
MTVHELPAAVTQERDARAMEIGTSGNGGGGNRGARVTAQRAEAAARRQAS